MRVGFGWDIHRLVAGRPLLLGGVRIPHDKGEDGWSDGDALCHALIDALLGAACLGDIGARFPPGDPRYRDIAGRSLLRMAMEDLRRARVRVVNADCTVVLEAPRIRPHVDGIRSALAEDLGIPPEAVSVKGKTKEGLDAAGEGRAVEAFAVVLVEEAP
jgi:2-C-methyl-D-erythritol 2,4-cyclodiphosphate synthase